MLSLRASFNSVIALAASVALLACSSGGGGGGGAGVPALAHKAGSCISPNGDFKSADGTATTTMQSTLIPGGVKLTNPDGDYIIDGAVHPTSQGESYQGACDGNSIRVNLMKDGKVILQGEITLAGDSLTISTKSFDPSTKDQEGSATFQRVR